MKTMTTIKTGKKLVLAAILAGMATGAHAITLSGAHVDFTFDETALGLFAGAYGVTGDTLTFSPTGFINDGTVSPLISSTVNVTVTPKLGQTFSSLGYYESGLFSQSSASSVDTGGQLRIYNPASPAFELTPSIVPNLDYSSTVANSPWNATITQDISTLSGAPKLNVTIQNLLIAYPLSEISKQTAQLTVLTTPVPEVETWTMMLAGVGLIALQLRRRTGSEARAIG